MPRTEPVNLPYSLFSVRHNPPLSIRYFDSAGAGLDTTTGARDSSRRNSENRRSAGWIRRSFL